MKQVAIALTLLASDAAYASPTTASQSPYRIFEFENMLLESADADGAALIATSCGLDFSRVTIQTFADSEEDEGEDVKFFTAELDDDTDLAAALGNRFASIDSLIVTGRVRESDFMTMQKCVMAKATRVINLENAVIDQGRIPAYAFYNHEEQYTKPGYLKMLNLRRIILPEGVTEIGEAAFARSRLVKINLPSTLRTLGKAVFMDCMFLAAPQIAIPEGVKELPMLCFANTDALGKVSLPTSLRSVGPWAFYNSGLREVELSEGLTKIGKHAFQSCRKLTAIELPESCTELSEAAFAQNYALKSCRLSTKTEAIGPEAFADCSALESIEIPGKPGSFGLVIEPRAFRNCTSLKTVILHEGIRQIRDEAFANCGIESLTVPASMVGINSGAFMNCRSLKNIYSMCSNPPVPYADMINGNRADYSEWDADYVNAFEGCDPTIPVYVPVGKAQAYRQTAGWDYFTNFVELSEFPSSTIDEVAADSSDAPAEYYNLQGIRVNEPAEGNIYIRRQGNRSTKVRF